MNSLTPSSSSSSPHTSTSEVLLSLDLSKTLHSPVKPRPNCCDICGRYFARYDNLERHRRTHLNQKLFDCEECGKGFSQKTHLKEHMTVHTGEHPFKCSVCGYAFSRKGNLSRHMKTHQERERSAHPATTTSLSAPSLLSSSSASSNSVITTATLLRKATSSISYGNHNVALGSSMEVQEHEEVETLVEDPDTIGIDNSSKSIISAFSRHHRKQHGDSVLDINSDNPFGCKACWQAFSQGSISNRNKVHERIHTALKPFKCDVCSKSFSQKSHLKVHRRIHTGERPFKCAICAFMFSRSDHLERHMRNHHGQKMYRFLGSSNHSNPGSDSSDQCRSNHSGQAQSGNNNKELPMSSSKSSSSNCNCCCKDDCGENTKQYKYNSEVSGNHSSLVNHDHEMNKDCKPAFSSQNGQVDSSNESDCEGNKPLDCSLCFKVFSKRSHESMHKKIHHAVLPFKCNICGKAFPQNGNLTRHRRTHMGEKRFRCDICGKAFSQRSHVKVHELIHVGNRPYKCNDCGYAFRRPDHLMRHKQANAGRKGLSCIPHRFGRAQNSGPLKKHSKEQAVQQTESQLISIPERRKMEEPLQHRTDQPLSLVQPLPLNLHSSPMNIPYYNTVSVAASLADVQPTQTNVSHHATDLSLGSSHHHANLAHHIALSHPSLPQTSALPQQLNIPLHPNMAHSINVPHHPGF